MGFVMAFVQFTRPDNSPVAISSEAVVTFAPVPADGPLKEGTRINLKNGGHQDVKEVFDEVARRLQRGGPRGAATRGQPTGSSRR
jgi:hypothetical protein